MTLRKSVALLVAASALGAACAPTIGGPGRAPEVVVVGNAGRGPRGLHVPPGHYPPPGECRLWYPGRPPGHQPPPTRCAALIGRVPLGTFVLYNERAWDADYDWHGHERRDPGSVPRIILELSIRRER